MNFIQDDDIDFNKYLEHPEAAHIRPLSHWGKQVKDELAGKGGYQGRTLPWSKTHSLFHFKPGQLTIWAGKRGHKKSMLNSQVMMSLAAAGDRICIASLEMPPKDTALRLLQMFCGVPKPAELCVNKFLEWVKDKIWIYDQLGTTDARRLVAVARYTREELGVNHYVIDSLMKCGVPSDGNGWMSAQRDFINELQTHCKNTEQCIHLVAHQRKSQAGKIADSDEVAGSADITNMADNVLIVIDNKEKRHAMENGDDYDEDDPDLLLRVDKQRKGKFEGNIGLFFDENSLQHVGGFRKPAIDFLQLEANYEIQQTV